MSSQLWYFAYGSNLDPDRFRDRVGEWSEHQQAILRDHELRFSGEVSSEGGGGAIIQGAPGKVVYGGVYRITPEQIALMDERELGSEMDPNLRGARVTIVVQEPLRPSDVPQEAGAGSAGSVAGSFEAEVYVVPEPKVYRAPSATYLGHITKGLRFFGYEEAVIAEVEGAASREPRGKPSHREDR
jgi:hypothetical protein